MSQERPFGNKGVGEADITAPVGMFAPKEGQILGAEKIKLGDRFLVHGRGSLEQITVVKAPFEENGETWIVAVVEFPLRDYIFTHKISLADRGVVPYKGGKMNGLNCLTLNESAVPDRTDKIRSEQTKKGRLREAAVLVLASAVEAEDPFRRLACLKAFAVHLEQTRTNLKSFDLDMKDIIAITNVAYQQQDGSSPMAQTIDAMASDALSAFPQEQN